jgi:hypothetical protein
MLEIANFVIGLLVWFVFIFGPFVLLSAATPRSAIVASIVALVLHVLSFRWRKGFVLIEGCLGNWLQLCNALTLCVASVFVARTAGLSVPVQFAVGLAGLPIVLVLVLGVERGANWILGPQAGNSQNRENNGSDNR